jgi:hypothetical protein
MDVAAADGASDLRIDRAQVAILVMRLRLILRLFGQYMRNTVRSRTLLREQQGEDKEQWQQQTGRSHGERYLNKAEGARQAVTGCKTKPPAETGGFKGLYERVTTGFCGCCHWSSPQHTAHR